MNVDPDRPDARSTPDARTTADARSTPDARTARLAAQLHEEFVASLVAAGALPDPAWRESFRRVPRHLFLPYFYDVSGVRIGSERRPEAWLRGVYSDVALVTQREGGEPTSSSSQPSLMASMLDALDVSDDSRVLEIGTGTGYNAALLADRLGEERVTSIDVAADLTAAARAHLATAGYRPRVITGDGALGWPDRAPYDRLISTCRTDRVPLPWLRQLSGEGGTLVGPMGSAVVRVRRTGPERAEGRFLGGAYFMPLRGPGGPAPAAPPADLADAERRPSRLPPAATGNPSFRFLVSLLQPDTDWRIGLDDAPSAASLRASDGSCAHRFGDDTVAEAGPRLLWSELEETWEAYIAAGHPAPERYGVSLHGEDQRLWLDAPDGPSWQLPPLRR